MVKLKTKDMAVFPKPKLVVPKMFLNQTPTPKIAPKDQRIVPKGPKKCKGGPKCGWLKNKKIRLYFQNKS